MSHFASLRDAPAPIGHQDKTAPPPPADAAAQGGAGFVDRRAQAAAWAQHFMNNRRNTMSAKLEWPEDAPLQPHKGDYRDVIPPTFEEVVEVYRPFVQDGQWTFGLFDMWTHKAKVVKQSVHIPCCTSFRFNPCEWRGVCFGRSLLECFFTAIDRTRWARYTYGAHMGREYDRVLNKVVPNKIWKTRIMCLTFLNYALGSAASFGVGQAVTLCPGGLDCAACFDCHPREKIRRKYNLPTTFGLPPGCDDCCVHFLCMYCASHQEARELAVRGVDGPGLHILDVLPKSFKDVPGIEEALAARQQRVEELKLLPPTFLPMEERFKQEPGLASRYIQGKVRTQSGKELQAGNGSASTLKTTA